MKIVCTIALAILLSAGPHSARTQVEEEFHQVLWKIAQLVDGYYIDAIPADSLTYATAQGMFQALDLQSDYDLVVSDANLGANFYTLLQMSQAITDGAHYAVPPDTLIRYGVAGMMQILDPYSVFMERQHLANFTIHTQGHYGGLGFRIQRVYPDSVIAVWALLHENTPAARAGVRSGDFIVAINQTSTRHMSVGDAADSMRGPPGTPVTLSLQRAGVPEPFQLTIKREEVQTQSVRLHTLFPEGTGYIKLDRFQSNTHREVRDAIHALQAQGMERLILDLRGNGGGYLKEAIKVADLFLPQDHLVVFTAGRALRDTTRYYTETPPVLKDKPLLVMVDQRSASASEIVAGAVQDWDRGLVLGSPTAGKGSVQQTVQIGDQAELKLTMAAWHTPSGRSIDRRIRRDSTLVSDEEKMFTTRILGRTVHGNGGITPDIATEGRRSTPLYNQLSGWHNQNSQFFHFAREYHLHDPDVNAGFRATDETLTKFQTFVENRGFEYVSEAEKPLLSLQEKMKEDPELERIKGPLETLFQELATVKEGHWEDNAALLKWKLSYDILEKNLGERAAIAYDVTMDPQIERARQVLESDAKYHDWFQHEEIGITGEAVAGGKQLEADR